MPEDASEFVGHSGDGFGGAQSGFPAAVKIAEVILSAPETLCGQAESLGDAAADIAGGSAQDFAAANAVIGADAQPGGEAFGGMEFVGKVRAQFGQQDQDGGCLEAGNGGQVNAQEAIRF